MSCVPISGSPGPRARTLHAVATLFAGGFTLHDSTTAEALRRLAQVPGIGPWTLSYIALRALGDPDAYPAGDAVLSRALRTHDIADAHAHERWAPYRGYATVRLWNAAAPRRYDGGRAP